MSHIHSLVNILVKHLNTIKSIEKLTILRIIVIKKKGKMAHPELHLNDHKT